MVGITALRLQVLVDQSEARTQQLVQDVYDKSDIANVTLQDYGIKFAIGLRYEQYLVYDVAAYGTLNVYEQCYTEEC